MDKMFDYESLFTYMSLIFAIAIFILVLYGCLSRTYNGNGNIEKLIYQVRNWVTGIKKRNKGLRERIRRYWKATWTSQIIPA